MLGLSFEGYFVRNVWVFVTDNVCMFDTYARLQLWCFLVMSQINCFLDDSL